MPSDAVRNARAKKVRTERPDFIQRLPQVFTATSAKGNLSGG